MRIAQLEVENAELKNKNMSLFNEKETLFRENAKLKILNDWYLEQFRLAQQRRFGRSSEKNLLPGQLALFNEAEVLADEPVPEDKSEETITYKRKKRKGKRDEFYEGLSTEQVIHELPEDERVCSVCGGAIHACGHDILRREVEIIPAQIKAIEHVQTVYSCRNCEKSAADDAVPMVKSNVPAPVISGSGIASPSLVSFIMCNKYVLALPLYRQEQELGRAGVHIARQTMSNWIIIAAMRWLVPIYEMLYEELLRNHILHADETNLQVVKEAGRSASQKSYMWMYQTGRDAERHIALYEYQPTREGQHPLKFLSGFDGFLHVDGYHQYTMYNSKKTNNGS